MYNKQKMLKEPKKKLTGGVRLSITANYEHYKKLMFFHHENKEFKWRIVYTKNNLITKAPRSVAFQIWSDGEISSVVARSLFIEWLRKNYPKDLECLLFVGALLGDLEGFDTWFDEDEEILEEDDQAKN